MEQIIVNSCSRFDNRNRCLFLAKYRANQGLASYLVVSPQKSHFNRKLNTCLSEETLISISTNETQKTKMIDDVVSGGFVLTTGVDTKTVNGVSTTTPIYQNLVNGVTPDEFAQQEEILMTE